MPGYLVMNFPSGEFSMVLLKPWIYKNPQKSFGNAVSQTSLPDVGPLRCGPGEVQELYFFTGSLGLSRNEAMKDTHSQGFSLTFYTKKFQIYRKVKRIV